MSDTPDRGDHWRDAPWPPTEMYWVRWDGMTPVYQLWSDVAEDTPGILVGYSISNIAVTTVGGTNWETVHPTFASAMHYAAEILMQQSFKLLAQSQEAIAHARTLEGKP